MDDELNRIQAMIDAEAKRRGAVSKRRRLRFNITLPADVLALLIAMAEQTGDSRSAIIEQAVRDFYAAKYGK